MAFGKREKNHKLFQLEELAVIKLLSMSLEDALKALTRKFNSNKFDDIKKIIYSPNKIL